MNLPLVTIFRLLPRDEGGLARDTSGVALGAAELVRVGADGGGRRRYETAPPQALGCVLSAAYGPQPEPAVLAFTAGSAAPPLRWRPAISVLPASRLSCSGRRI